MIVWLLQTGEPLHIDNDDSRPMRAMNLADMLIKKGHKVTLWSAKFNHRLKMQRDLKENNIYHKKNLEIKLISSPGYKKNISLARFYDHLILANNLRRTLRDETEFPDIVFIGFPPIEIAVVMSEWCKRNKIPTILDIKDQWPHFFVESAPFILKPFLRLCLSPLFYITKRMFKQVNSISANSQSFLDWSMKFGETKNNSMNIISPLTTRSITPTTNPEIIKWWKNRGIITTKKRSIIFVGTHYPSLDFYTVIEAAKLLRDKKVDCDIIICGSGELTDELISLSSKVDNIKFPGWVNNEQISLISDFSLAALAPFRNIDNYTVNLPNKIIDSLSNGLPIISPLKGEVEKMINKFEVGLTYYEGCAASLAEQIISLVNDRNLQLRLSNNAKNLYNKNYSYEKVYGDLVSHIESMVK